MKLSLLFVVVFMFFGMSIGKLLIEGDREPKALGKPLKPSMEKFSKLVKDSLNKLKPRAINPANLFGPKFLQALAEQAKKQKPRAISAANLLGPKLHQFLAEQAKKQKGQRNPKLFDFSSPGAIHDSLAQLNGKFQAKTKTKVA